MNPLPSYSYRFQLLFAFAWNTGTRLMHYVPRHIEAKLIHAARHYGFVVLYGPRKVGKLSILRKVFPTHRIIKLNPVFDVEGIRGNPLAFLENQKSPFILHNIHHAPELIPHLLSVASSSEPGRILVTSVCHLPVLKALDSTRCLALRMGGLSFEERLGLGMRRHWLDAYLASPSRICHHARPMTREHESMIHYLWRGGMPHILKMSDKQVLEAHYAYLQTYAESDARQVEPIFDLSAFGRFLSELAHHSAKPVRLNALAQASQISPVRAQAWLKTLHETFQFENLIHLTDRDAKGPKRSYHYCRDSGIMSALLDISSPFALAINPHLGSVFKTWCHNDILNHLLSLDETVTQWYWDDGNRRSVSLVLESKGKLYPIDIQCITDITKDDGANLLAFQKAHGKRAQHGILLYAGKTIESLSRNWTAIPWNAEIS